METVVCVSGFFNPLHFGHLKLFYSAKKLGDKLVVIVNNDDQVKKKRAVAFMPEGERAAIVSALKPVDEVIISMDTDLTVNKTLRYVKPDIFANGGDRTKKKRNIPEAKVCKELGIQMLDGVGGDKINSSSSLIQKAKFS